MKISIIGGGNMGGAIARGLAQSSADYSIKVADLNETVLRNLQNFNNKIEVSTNSADIVTDADIVMVAVKPWLVETIMNSIKDKLDYSKQIIISIAAGVSFEQIASFLNKDGNIPSLIRIIPNTAIDVLQSVNCIANHNASAEQLQTVESIFSELGENFIVQENQINAFMALSSCGIAFAFRYIRANIEGAVEMGIYPQVAKQVVAQTMKGAVDLIQTYDNHPELEIDKVTTPGGTTIKGLNELQANGFNNAIIKALKKSCGM